MITDSPSQEKGFLQEENQAQIDRRAVVAVIEPPLSASAQKAGVCVQRLQALCHFFQGVWQFCHVDVGVA